MNTEIQQLKIGNLFLDVVRKDIKNVHLSVHPPTGRVRIAAPLYMHMDTVRVFAISKLSWIRKQQIKFHQQNREPPREYITRESHYFFGKRYLFKVIEDEAPPEISITHATLQMRVRPSTPIEKRQQILNEWYRQQLKELIPSIIAKYEKIMKVSVNEFRIKKMRTKWGTCNREAKRLWLNLELAKKPKHCIEYIVVHEMVHLFERNHNERFTTFMDEFIPQWRSIRDELNRAPLSHVDWEY